MTIRELIDELKSCAPLHEAVISDTCDTVKAGTTDKELTGVGVTMFATPEVIREAAKQGLNLLIVHEPLCYDHMDSCVPFDIGYEKYKLLDEYGITVFRFHDYAHSLDPDLIFEGQTSCMKLSGRAEKGRYYGVNRFVLDKEMTARELARHLENRLHIRHVRIAGSADRKGRYLSCCFGAPGHTGEELAETDFVLTGELCEWREGELARDYAQLGYNKAILVMGHVGSERDGMRLLADRLSQRHADLSVRYLECGELYSYTDEPTKP